jgi:hypothetical protein
MPAETLSCPYCNSHLTVSDGAHVPVACPRCGETLPYRTGNGPAHPANGWALSDPNAAAVDDVVASRRRSNRHTGLWLLGGMFALAGLACTFILLTHDFRRSNDLMPGPATALAYLPSDTNLAALVRVQRLRDQPAGKDVLDFLGLAAAEDGRDPAQPFLGVPLDNLDILLLSMKSDADHFRPILLVQTRRPYDPEIVGAVLDTGRPIQDGYRTVYQVRSPKLGFGAVWFAATNVLVLAANVDTLEAVPKQPGTDALPESLGSLIKDPNGLPAWVIGQGQQWQTDLGPWLAALAPRAPAAIGSVHGFAAWFAFDKDVTVHAKIDCDDVKGATRVARLLSGLELPDVRLAVARSDIQVTLQVTADMATLRRAVLGTLLDPAKKP